MYMQGEPDHDIIEIGPEFLEQKGNVLLIAQPTKVACDIRPSIVRYMHVVSCSLPLLFSCPEPSGTPTYN